MALTADSLLDRMRLKSQLSKWRILAIFLGVLCLIILVARSIDRPFLSQDYIARLSIDGIILEDKERHALLESLTNDDKVQAVILHINSPGGTFVGGESIYDDLTMLSKKKPVVTVMGNVAASGAYMAAIATDHIVAHKGTITGSIGVILQTAEITELTNKLGIKFINFKSGALKASPSPFEKVTPKMQNVLNVTIKESFNIFLNLVKSERQLSATSLKTIADGRIFIGTQAHKIGLIDALGGEKEARNWLEKEKNIAANITIKDVKPKNASSQWSNMISSWLPHFFTTANQPSLQGLLALWQPNL